jgi:hypothetical protein
MHRGDELVPSRYALKVGDIDVMVISDGLLPIPAVTMATNAATADLAAWLSDMFLPPEMLDWPLNVAVVRSGGRTILIDSGLGTSSRASRGPGSWPCDWTPPGSIPHP